MKVQKNNVVELTYELIVDGKLADKATQERPLGYIHGTHMLLPKFESEVEGNEPGDEFAFTLTPEEGYGTFDASRLFELPKAAFEIDGKVREDLLVVGQIIPMLSNTGQVVQGTVHEVKPDTVVMDFNHPMAGKTLNSPARWSASGKLRRKSSRKASTASSSHRKSTSATAIKAKVAARATRMANAATEKARRTANAATATATATKSNQGRCARRLSY